MVTASTSTLAHAAGASRLAHTHPALDAELTQRFIRTALAAFPDLQMVGVQVLGERMLAQVQVPATNHISEWVFPLRTL